MVRKCACEELEKISRLRHKKISDGYEKFSTYIVIRTLGVTTNVGRVYLYRRMMT